MAKRIHSDEEAMQLALEQAHRAALAGEVPVGAVIVHDHQIIAEGFNCPISTCDPTAHAEIVVMRRAAEVLKNYRLVDVSLYVTLEPCIMCVGAMVHARINRLIYGASDPKAGAATSQLRAPELSFLNHRFQVTGGMLADDCARLLTDFFRSKR